jgi:SET domain-containing protein
VLPKKYRDIKRELVTKRSESGLGLYTKAPIEKAGFIIEYTGPILTRKEADKKGGKYLFETSSARYVDGSGRSNLARYINHSCKPNCEVEIMQGRVFIFSKRAIPAGAELSYDYGKEYFNEYIKPLGCKCEKCSK